MQRDALERLSKTELIELVLRLQRPEKTSRTSSKPESFFASLKNEHVHQVRFRTREEARTAVFEYIEVFYNR